MNHIIKQSLKTSAVNYVGIALGALFTLYISPKYLTTEYNGLYRLLIEYATVAGAYFHFGIPSIVNKYFHRIFDDSKRTTRGFDFIVLLVPIIAIAVLALLLIGFRGGVAHFLANSSDLELIGSYLLYIIPLIVANAYSLLIEAYTAMLGRIVAVNFYRNVLVKLFNIASVVVYTFTQNFTLTMTIIAVGSLLSVALSFINLGRLKAWKFDLRPSWEFLRVRGLGGDFMRYALYLMGGNLTLFLVTKIDIFFVGKLATLSDVAYYTTALFMIVFIAVPYQAVLNISFPQISRAFVEGDHAAIRTTLKNNALFGFASSLFIGLMIWINLDTIYVLMPSGELYSAGKYVFLILALGKIIDTSIGSLGQLLTVSRWYIYTFYFSIALSLISIGFGYGFTLRWGIYGTAVAMAACNLINVVYQLCVVQWRLRVTPYNHKFLWVLLLILPILAIDWAADLAIRDLWANMCVKTIVATITFFGLIYRFRLSDEIVQIIRSLARQTSVTR